MSRMLMEILPPERLRHLPHPLDLTQQPHLARVRELADVLLERRFDGPALAALEQELMADKAAWPLALHLAVKLARSRHWLLTWGSPCHLSVVFAVYKEHTRILRREEHPHGENFLLRKLEQLRWLGNGAAGFQWDLTVVDDGCPEGSGTIAQRLLTHHPELAGQVRVLHLARAIAAGDPLTHPMRDTSESQKGGAIAYGMGVAARTPRPGQVILYTDADLSTHLGQAGLLMAGILEEGRDVVAGSRRERASVVVKQGRRNTRGKLFIYLWQRLLAPLAGLLVDTQCGFKAFRGERVPALVAGLSEKRFAFDLELLLRAELHRPRSVGKAAIVWIDSEAASTTTDLQPYLPMLKSIAGFYRRYLPPDPAAEAFATWLEGLDPGGWERLVANPPAGIVQREPMQFATFDGVTVAELARLAEG